MTHFARGLLAALIATTLAAPAAAQPVAFDAFDLAGHRIALPAGGPTAAGAPTRVRVGGAAADGVCEAVDLIAGGLQEAGPGSCPALWGMTRPQQASVAVTVAGAATELALEPRATQAAGALTLHDGQLVGPLPDGPVAILDGKRRAWTVVTASGGRASLSAGAVATASQRPAFAYTRGPKLREWTITTAKAAEQAKVTLLGDAPRPPASAPGAAASRRGGAAAEAPLECPPPGIDLERDNVVCVDASDDQLRYRVFPDNRIVVKPNRVFHVVIRHRADRRVNATMGGTIGTYVPGSKGDVVAKLRAGALGIGGPGEAAVEPPLVETRRTFAPRVPGEARLRVVLEEAATRKEVATTEIEFYVTETYAGALRLGVGAVFLNALDVDYRASTYQGSEQAEITASERPVLDLDLVVGYAPYFDSGGRPSTGCESAPACFSPFFGIGLLADGPEGIEFFKSVHVGAEWEPIPNFSIAVTGVLRRVQRLRAGYEVGSPIEGGVPTDSKWLIGLGVVLNLSPDFLKLGARGARAFVAK